MAWLGWCGVPTGSGGASGGDRQKGTNLPGIGLGGCFLVSWGGEVLVAPTRQQATSMGAV